VPGVRGRVVIDIEALARALYETSPGTNGYPPLHKSIPWCDLTGRELYVDRAREIASKLAKGWES
jgi:hypothetical protein